jgi:pyruvate/2-oxoglutarate dehydrogenase complex dihydrolipoamide dehydrogenase (E3) component
VTEIEVDAVVVGMGPGGEDAAGKLAKAGLRVVGIEKELVGGECPYWGCIPSKMMIRAANSLAEARRVAVLAGSAAVVPDFAPVAARIRDEATDDWNDQVAVDRFTGKGGVFVRGAGTLLAPDLVAVGDVAYRASRAVIVATGTAVAVPPIPGLSETPYWTNREAISITRPPQSLIVLGGGAIGVELAQSLSRFGTEVAIVEAAPRILPLEEPEVSQAIAEVLAAEGIAVHTGTPATRVDYDGSQFAVSLGGRTITGQQLLVATGRRADTAAIGAETLGVDGNSWLPVDEHLRVVPGVWAVGDVTGKGAFTHVAMYQSRIAVGSILGRPGPGADYSALPRVTFTDPEVGSVGLTEEKARAAGLRVAVGSATVGSTSRGWLHKVGNEGIVKLVADAGRGVLVGATSMGPAGGEVLSGLALAVHARIPIETLRNMMYAYPTFYRGIEDALRGIEA